MALEERFFPGSEVEGLSVHTLSAVLWDLVLGFKATRAAALVALNATLTKGPLTVAEEADLNTIADAIDAEIGQTAKLFKVMDYEMVLRQVASGADYQTLPALRARLGI